MTRNVGSNLKHIFVLIAVGIFLAVIYASTRIDDQKQHQKMISLLTDFEKADTIVSHHLLRIRYGQLKHYDVVNEDRLRLLKIFNSLSSVLSRHDFQYSSLKDYRLLFDERDELVNQYISHFAIYRNSLSYLPHAVADLERQSGLVDHAMLDNYKDLLRLALLYDDSGSMEIKQQIFDMIELVRKDLQQESLKLDFILQHIEKLVQHSEEIIEIFNDILKVDTAKAIENVKNQYFIVYDKQLRQADFYAFMLSVLTVLMLLFIGYSLLRIKRFSDELGEANRKLEFQKFALDEHAIVSVADVKGNITYINDKFCDISQYSRQELLGKNHRILKSDEHDSAFFKDLWRTIANGETWHGELKNFCKDGSVYWVNATIVPFLDERGKPFQYVSIRTDITDTKLLEQEFRDTRDFLANITDVMQEGLYVVDQDGELLYMNSKASELLGEDLAAFAGKDFHSHVIHHSSPESQCRWLHQAMEKHESFFSEEISFTNAAGNAFPVYLSISPYRNAEAIGNVVVFNDLTDKMQLRDETLARKQAEASNRMRGEFLANMSHEMRTPMNAIIGMSHLVLKSELNTKQTDYVGKIKHAAEYLLVIMNDILDFSKIDAGHLSMEQINFNLSDVLKNLDMILENALKDKNVNLRLDLADDLPNTLIGDPIRLGQILINLGNNAIKFTDSGEIIIAVVKNRQENDIVELLFSVKDTGIGIAPDKQKKIFSAFSQADSSTTRQYGGTGLGLTIARKLVEQMDGEINVDSVVGQGSTFFFTVKLPVAAEQISSSEQQPVDTISEQQQFEQAMQKLQGTKVLLVEDNEINQELVLELLITGNITVEVASNGKEALELLENDSFAAVLMDCQMPVMDGYTATRKIREQKQYDNMPVIALTANVMEGDREKCEQSGMDDMIAKPINVHKMFTTMARWIKPD